MWLSGHLSLASFETPTPPYFVHTFPGLFSTEPHHKLRRKERQVRRTCHCPPGRRWGWAWPLPLGSEWSGTIYAPLFFKAPNTSCTFTPCSFSKCWLSLEFSSPFKVCPSFEAEFRCHLLQEASLIHTPWRLRASHTLRAGSLHCSVTPSLRVRCPLW